jgi:DNA-binding response OmpR family regulator
MTAPAARHVLLVDDDPNLIMFLGDRLRRDGYEITTAMDARAALAKLDDRWPDVVILDLMLPGMAGEEVARRIKRRADIPVIVLSAVSAGEAKVEMISRYAEDYVTKPFQYAELEARMRRILHRVGGRAPAAELRLGPNLTLILPRRRAIVAGREVSISPIETRLLGLLAGRLGSTFSTDDVLASVWSAADGADPAYVWVTIRRLRQKLEVVPDEPVHLVTVAGEGYRLVAAEPDGLSPA